MNEMKKLFLSFSAANDPPGRAFVRQLFERFQQQPIDPWVFESSGGEIEAGASISAACRRKIEESDIFVLLITDQALESAYVSMEVGHALSEARRRSLPLVPLIATTTRTSTWPAPIAEATDFRGITLPARSLEAIETVVVHVCDRLQVAYTPPKPGVPRLPLRQRLSEELQDKQSLSAYGAGDFINVLRKCDVAVEALVNRDYRKARRVLEAILTDLEIQYGMTDAYYPRIAYGATLMAEAQAGDRSFVEVEHYFATLIAENGSRLDANAFAGRANALMALGRFDDALVMYRAAEPYLESPDPALFYNMIRAHVLGGLPMDRSEVLRRRAALDEGILTRRPGDLARLTSSVSLAYAYLGDVDAALAAWRDIDDVDAVFPEVVVDIAHHLHRHATANHVRPALEAAHFVIADYMAVRSDLSDIALVPLQQQWARVMFDRGERNRARQELRRVIDRFPATPVLHIDAAMFALADGDRPSARRLCEAVVSLSDRSQCHPQLTSPEFNFALGHAFWLLGKCSEARESFRRSEYASSLWYEITMPGECGILE